MDEERADGGACLEPNHKRFILVGKNNQWGDETQLRFALASHFSYRLHVPLVVLVIQGGPGTLKSIHTATTSQEPHGCAVLL
eukprot:6979813-Prymnesium_polylepis.2